MKRLIVLCIVLFGIAGTSVASDIRLTQKYAGFDLEAFVTAEQPDWLGHVELIGHWSAYFQISPLALLAALEVGHGEGWFTSQSQADIAALAERLSQQRKSLSPDALVPQGAVTQAQSRRSMDAFEQLFSTYKTDMPELNAALGQAVSSEPVMILPIESERDWFFNGVHTWTGNDNGNPMSSIDLLVNRSHRWGDDTSNIWVVSAHDGVVNRFSECFVRVTHSSGWFTDYYHLENVQVQTGQQITAGTRLSNYADDLATATCQGGRSDLPHLHFALGRNANRVSLTLQRFSDHRVHPGRFSYDRDPAFMWLDHLPNQQRLTAWVDPIRTSTLLSSIDFHFNGMWFQPSLSGHAIELVTMANDDGTNSVFVVMFTYDDSGLANFYSGNVTVDSWTLGEALTVPLFQSANGGFSEMSTIDFSAPQDFDPAGEVVLTFDDCEAGTAAFGLLERSNGALVQQQWELTKVIGVPVDLCRESVSR